MNILVSFPGIPSLQPTPMGAATWLDRPMVSQVGICWEIPNVCHLS